jgi:hypothetical protein
MNSAGAASAPARQVRLLERARYGEWDALVDRSPHGCVFHHSWWLEATGWPFEILVAQEASGAVVAGMPLPRKRLAGLKLFYTPPLSPYVGPVFDVRADAEPSAQIGFMREAGEELAAAIRDYDGLSYWVGPRAPDLQGFLWAGFRAELGYTFRFEAGTTPAAVLAGADAAHVGKIRRAERAGVVVEETDDVERGLRLSRMTFERQAMDYPWSDDLVRRLWHAARERGVARLYVGKTTEGQDAAASLVVHDGTSSYHVLAGGDPALRSLGAGNLVLLRAISEALDAGRAFDFEGSELRGVEWHYRRWGASPRPVYLLQRAGTVMGAVARLWRRRGRYKQAL